MKRIYFITGTDTGVGKTVLTVLLTRHLRAAGIQVRAVKPFCSGGRDDAEALFGAQGGEVPLDVINPWHFAAPLAPLLAARRERQQVTLPQATRFLGDAARRTEVLLIEGAGGLLSPLGEGFSARELISATRAWPIVVCPNRLGAVNQARLVAAALTPAASARARLVLVGQARPDASARDNRLLLAELIGAPRIGELPWMNDLTSETSGAAAARCLDWLVTASGSSLAPSRE